MAVLSKHGWIRNADGTNRRITLIEQLQNYSIDINTGCHIWNGQVFQTNGYGCISVNSKPRGAHKLAYEQYVGKIPKDKIVRHNCHNRLCINPKHLSIGTVQDNSNDMIAANRSLKGEKNHKAKLTVKDVLRVKELLDQGYRTCTVAKMFNRHWSTIKSIKTRKNWSHLA